VTGKRAKVAIIIVKFYLVTRIGIYCHFCIYKLSFRQEKQLNYTNGGEILIFFLEQPPKQSILVATSRIRKNIAA